MLSLSISRQNIHPVSNGGVFTETNITGPSDLNHVIQMHIRSYSKCYAIFLMQVQSFFKDKDSQKSQPFFSYEGSSKDPITGSAKLKTGKYQEPEEYPMGEWSPSGQDEYPMGEWSPVGESSFIAETVLSTLGQDFINDPNTSPTSDDLCTTCFPMSEW